MSIKLTLSSFKRVTWSYIVTVLHSLFKTTLLTWLKNFSLKHVFIRSNILLVKALPCRLDQEPLSRICKTEGPVNSAFEVDADQVEFLLKFTDLVTPDNFRVSLIHLETIELVFFFCGEIKLRSSWDFSPFHKVWDLFKATNHTQTWIVGIGI